MSWLVWMILESESAAALSELTSQIAPEEVPYSFRTSVPVSRGRSDTCHFEHRPSVWICAATTAIC
jgi:hypothetical protein